MNSMPCKLSRALSIATFGVLLFACTSTAAQAGEPVAPAVSSSVAAAAVTAADDDDDEAPPPPDETLDDADPGAAERQPPAATEPPAELDAVFHEGRSAVEYCRKRVARNYGRQQGRLKLAVTIDTGGRVTRIAVLENEATDKMAECMGAVIETWTFPAPSTPVTVERLWVFG